MGNAKYQLTDERRAELLDYCRPYCKLPHAKSKIIKDVSKKVGGGFFNIPGRIFGYVINDGVSWSDQCNEMIFDIPLLTRELLDDYLEWFYIELDKAIQQDE